MYQLNELLIATFSRVRCIDPRSLTFSEPVLANLICQTCIYTDDSKDERKTHVQNSIEWKQEGEYYMYRADNQPDRDRYRQGDELGL